LLVLILAEAINISCNLLG